MVFLHVGLHLGCVEWRGKDGHFGGLLLDIEALRLHLVSAGSD